MMGPSLIDLSEIFHTSIQKASNIGVVADVGALIGPVFGKFTNLRHQFRRPLFKKCYLCEY